MKQMKSLMYMEGGAGGPTCSDFRWSGDMPLVVAA